MKLYECNYIKELEFFKHRQFSFHFTEEIKLGKKMKLILIGAIFCLLTVAYGQLIPINEEISDEIRAEIRANQTKNNIRGRVGFGYRAYPGQFPFAAWLHFLLEGNWITMCGATLIKSDFVVTAAHCMGNFRAIDIWSGSIDKNNFPFFSKGSFYVKHPLWQAPDSYNMEHDIGLIQLATPMPSVTPAFLPPRWSTGANYEGQTMIIAGWGNTELGRISQFLLFQRVIGIPISGCGSIRSDKVICAKYKETINGDGSKAGGGDSGGPVLTEGNTFIGIISFGSGGGSGYTRVDRYIDWIVGYTNLIVQ